MKFSGTVVKGSGKANELFGLPTANVELGAPSELEPGVYAAWATVEGREYQAAAYVSPKFPKLIEVHLFQFSGDLYGKLLEIQVLEKTSPHVDWVGPDHMKAKVKDDLKKVQAYFGQL